MRMEVKAIPNIYIYIHTYTCVFVLHEIHEKASESNTHPHSKLMLLFLPLRLAPSATLLRTCVSIASAAKANLRERNPYDRKHVVAQTTAKGSATATA